MPQTVFRGKKTTPENELKLGGAFTALVTPMGNGGSIRFDDFKRNIEFQLQQGINGLVPTGTTGESTTLGWQEHCALISETIHAVNGRAFVLAGTGSNCTSEAITASLYAAKRGANGVLCVDPYYNKPASHHIYEQYYKPIARAIQGQNPRLPVIPYIIPGRTCCKLEPENLKMLARECPNVVGVKEATGYLPNMQTTRQLLGEDFIIFSGDDNLTAAMMTHPAIRANGVISVMSNLFPGPISKMVAAFASGKNADGHEIAGALEPLFKLVGVTGIDTVTEGEQSFTIEQKFPNPCPIKTMMAGLGMINVTMREPLGLINRNAMEQLRNELLDLWNKRPGMLMPIQKFYGVSISDQLTNRVHWKNLCYQ